MTVTFIVVLIVTTSGDDQVILWLFNMR